MSLRVLSELRGTKRNLCGPKFVIWTEAATINPGAMIRLSAVIVAAFVVAGAASAPSDLDVFMREVLARRDDNWKKLQQYVLDEREQIELRGPSQVPIWGERRDYIWYLRDGFFVRSPVRVNGAPVPEADRVKYERAYLERARERDKRRGNAAPAASEEPPRDVDALIRQTRQPQFISSAYFLRFRFEEGKYAFVGRETLDGHEVLRIEYYPSKMFRGTDRRRGGEATDSDRSYDAEFQRLMNKVALVTLWVEPDAHQIVKYTFENVSFAFLPVQWLVHVDDVHASMRMSEPVPDVWLPHDLDMSVAITLAAGRFDVHYGLEYRDYRRADVKTKVTIK
jgi:hypothetical protein